uniref:Ig-like domain-containing protein n=1 Tax=Oreochromis niloticus TaxID=8128 RepID=I3KVI4_ORENI
GLTEDHKPTVTLQPSWTQIYSGETVTVRCEIQGGEGAQWTYEWRAAKLNTPPTSNEYRIIRATESDSGGYSCRGRRDYFLTEWSDTITLTVLCKLKKFNLNSFIENCYSVFNKKKCVVLFVATCLYYAIVNSIFYSCVRYLVLNQSIKVLGFG